MRLALPKLKDLIVEKELFRATRAMHRWMRGMGQITVLEEDVTNNDGTPDTLADVTGLSFDVDADRNYWFRFHIYYHAAATTTGSRWTLNGPATTLFAYRSSWPIDANTTQTQNSATYDGTTVTASSRSTNITIIEGFIQPSADGTLIARFASEVASSAIVAKAGSFVEWRVLPQ